MYFKAKIASLAICTTVIKLIIVIISISIFLTSILYPLGNSI